MKRFSKSVNEIAELIGGTPVGDGNLIVEDVNRIENAGEKEIAFLADKKFIKYIEENKPGCVIVPGDFSLKPAEGRAFIAVENPYLAFVELLRRIDSESSQGSGVHPSAIVADSAKIGDGAWLKAGCVVGENAVIGDKVEIGENAVVQRNCSIGDGTRIFAGAIIRNDVEIGKNCIIHEGAVVGSEGFGFTEDNNGVFERIPQIGTVIVEDDVEIGANTTIDRAIAGATIIKKGVKLDNLIQIAHNCEIGENTAMAAQTGVSGSVSVGARNRFGGQVGVAGHLETADDVILYANSKVAKTVKKSGVYFGWPIKEAMHQMRIEAVYKKLPDFYRDFNKIKKFLVTKFGKIDE